MNDSVSADFLRRIVAKTKLISKEIAIFIVANIKSDVMSGNDYSSHSVITEYFSENELEEIVSAFRANGIFTEISFDEDDFISKIQNGLLNRVPHKYKIVYNTAQKGTGPGRKSLIPAFCNMNSISIMGSNAYVRSLCRHKYHCYALLKQHGVQQINAWSYDYRNGWMLSQHPPDGIKLILKPAYESASIGIDQESIFIMTDDSEKKVRTISRKFDQPVIVEEFISGYEVEVPLFSDSLNTYALGCAGISVDDKRILNDIILTYNLVYDDQYNFYDFNDSQIDVHNIIQLAINSFLILGIEGLGRVDFRVTSDGKAFITDIATNPHIVRHSSFAYLFEKAGMEYQDLPIAMLALAAKKYEWI